MAQAARRPSPVTPPVEQISPEELQLDSRNPRLRAPANADQSTLLKMLWEDGALDELALSIAHNSYFSTEPLFAVIEGGKHVVVEGNRRLATVKLLRDPELRETLRATDLPSLDAHARRQLDTLPVCTYPNRKSLWAYVGFRHVKGAMVWDSWSKAQYIAQVKNAFGIPLPEIAESIGDNNQTVLRLYRGLMVLNQAVEQTGYRLDDRSRGHLSFSHLYTGLDYSGFQGHLGLEKNGGYKPNPVAKRYWPNLRELMVWLYGSKEEAKAPLVRTQNPDLKRLDDVLKDPKALSALRSGLGLEVSHQLSRSEAARFREVLTHAKYDLQQAKGLVLEGFKGERDLFDTTQSICQLAESLRDDMTHRLSRPSARSRQ
ncbi:MAG: hypothetical protein ACREF4_06350 [Gammaproteobacteria bacterium]